MAAQAAAQEEGRELTAKEEEFIFQEHMVYFLNKTYIHQNHTPNYSWVKVMKDSDGKKTCNNSVGTPQGKGQQLILLHCSS